MGSIIGGITGGGGGKGGKKGGGQGNPLQALMGVVEGFMGM
ncbi:MAG TPA: hypothetical protein VGO93_12335 [Candidatus Xenobia bacterium]|jgi:hypothetical protein